MQRGGGKKEIIIIKEYKGERKDQSLLLINKIYNYYIIIINHEGIHLSFMYAVFLSPLTTNLERCLKDMFESEVFYFGEEGKSCSVSLCEYKVSHCTVSHDGLIPSAVNLLVYSDWKA